MVTQTCGCAEADAPAARRPAKAKIIRTKCLVMSEGQTFCAGKQHRRVAPGNIARSAAEWRPQIEARGLGLGSKAWPEAESYIPAAPPSARGSWAPSSVPF